MKYLTALLITVCLNTYGQKQGNIWFFGDSVGLDFNSGIPVPISGGQTYYCQTIQHNEGSSVISDSSGALLFYTNGTDVWNKFHQLMPNGTGLEGSISATQSSLILPLPGSSKVFYVFTVDGFVCGNNLRKGLRYSIIDICLDGGNGDIIDGGKNIPLIDTTAEKLTAIKDANGIDYWVVTHKYFSNAFYAFKLTSSGLAAPVISHVGSLHTGGTQGAIGQLKASPNGQKLAIASGNGNNHIELFDFNNITGIISNTIILPRPFPDSRAYGVSFSPDNSKVYFTMMSISPIETRLIQFDLNAGIGDSASIAASGTTIWNSSSGAYSTLGLQLGPDGKIYLMMSSSVINYPNLNGTACDFQMNAVPLYYGGVSYCFPNLLDSYLYDNTSYFCTTDIKENHPMINLNIYPNPSNGIFTLNNTNAKQAFIYNTLGEQVKSIVLKQGNNTIDLSHLPNGIYFIQCGTKNAKVVVESQNR